MARTLRFFWLPLAIALVLACGTAQAISLPAALGSSQAESSDSNQQVDPKQLKKSLDNVIDTLNNDQKRAHLVKQLQNIRSSLNADQSHDQESGAHASGLLGAISSSLGELSKHVESDGSALPFWQRHLDSAISNLQGILTNTPTRELLRNLVGIFVGVALWLAAVLALAYLGRRLFARLGWPLILPPEPGLKLTLLHVIRRLIPTLLVFVVLLIGNLLLDIAAPIATTILVIAYISLCGRLLTTVFDVIISLLTSGHRRVAVSILHRIALNSLFVIGALVALGDAVGSNQISRLLGVELSYDMGILANALAGLITAVLVLRIRRPVAHLIGNRSYAIRQKRKSYQELVSALSRLWHIPALLLVIASMVATFVTGGSTHASLAKAFICAILLVFALIASGLLRRQYEKRPRRLQRNDYILRLRKLGYTLSHIFTWAVFFELSLRIWGVTLFGLGKTSLASGHIGQALINFVLTIVIAWLIWIFSDTAIHRALRNNNSRAQTITPMIRNILLFTIIIVAIISSLSSLGVDITPLLAGAGVVGIALGFGAQHLVSDLITGIFILIEDSLAVGDFVEINGNMGTVEGLNMRNVRLRDLDAIVHITNFSKIDSIHNMSREFGIALIKIRIPFDLPIDDAIELMHRTAADLQKDPFIRGLIRSHLEIQDIHEFDNGCPILRMRMRTAPEYQWNVSRAFNLALKRRMEAEKINLSAPRMSISMEAGGGVRYDKYGKSSGSSAATMDWPIDENPPADAH